MSNEAHIKELEEKYEKLKQQFDPYYQWSDDFSVYRRHEEIKEKMARIRKNIKELSEDEVEQVQQAESRASNS